MNNRILVFVIVILLTNFICAYEITITPETITPISMFSGETETINLTLCHNFKQTQKLDLSYNITNNTFNLDGLYISFLENPVYTDNCKDIQMFIATHPLYKPDLWVLEIYAETFYKGKKYSVGDDAPYWQCGNWSECIDGIQIRSCEDLEKELQNRSETKECFLEFVPLNRKNNESENILNANQESSAFTNVLTGAVIERAINFVKSGTGIIIFISLIGVLTTVFAIRSYKFKQQK